MMDWRPRYKKSSAPFAYSGDNITCPNGHVVGVVKATVFRNGPVRTADFDLYNSDPKPYSGMPVNAAKCKTCGECFLGPGINGRVAIHINGRWVP